MIAFLARRLLYAVFVIFGAVTIIFVIVRLLPGDPIRLLVGPDTPAATVQAIRERLGLNDPLPVQYLTYLGGILRFDFGDSIYYGGPAMAQVLRRVPTTMVLAVSAMTFAILVSFPLGIAAARRPNSLIDRAVGAVSLTAQSIPGFWVGIMLILVFARQLQLLPSGGTGTWQQLIMPAVTLGLPFVGILVRLVRGGLLEVLGEGYVQTARAKGLSERVVVYCHAVRNMLIPVVTVIGLELGSVLGGTVIVETVFAWPGVGRLLVDAIFGRDFTIVQAAIVFIATMFVLLNLLVDVLYGFLDPRVRVMEAR